MKPILFPASEKTFSYLGIGVLADATSCFVTEERNGIYELQMQYPITGRHYSSIQNRCILYCEVNSDGEKQPFRIYRITKPMRGIVTVYAQHISYDLSGIVLAPFSANTIQVALAGIKSNSSTDNPFTFETDKTTAAAFSVTKPSTVRSIMGGQSGSLLDAYGGEYRYDHFTVSLLNARGIDRGVTIRYGKNLLDLTQEENIQSVCTGVYPFWTSDAGYVELPEKVLAAPGTYDFVKIKPLDASSHFDEQPTVDALRAYAQSYMEANNIGVPSVSISVKFAALDQTDEYADFAHLYRVKLCDTVSVVFDALGVNASAKCIKTVYDVLKHRYKEIALGDAKTNITDTIITQGQEIKKAVDPSAIQSIAESATQLITGNKGGFVVLHSSTGGQTPDEILVMDSPSITSALQVWRWNKSGLGYSSTGYNGTYGLAVTMDGHIVADFIKTGTLDAEQITVLNLIANAVKSVSGNNTMMLDGASLILKMTNGEKKNVWLTNINDGYPVLYMFDTEADVANNASEMSPHHLKIGGTSANPAFSVVLNIGKSTVSFDSLSPSGDGNCAWEYDDTLGKTILVRR